MDERARPGEPAVLDGVGQVLLDSSPNAVVGVDATGTIRYVNARLLALFGYERAEVLGHPIETLVADAVRERHLALRTGYLDDPQPRPVTFEDGMYGRHRSGEVFPVRISLTPVHTPDGLLVIAAVIDVSAQVASERQLRRLGRVWRTLAETNQAIVRAPDAETLFRETCRIAVDPGGYLGSFVGVPTEDGRLVPLTQAGALADYFAELAITLDPDHPRGRGPIARSYREQRPIYTLDFAHDPTTLPWRALAEQHGIRAAAMLPVHDGGGATVAVLALYSAETDIFDTEMRVLLEAMADNLSFALDAFRHQAELAESILHRGELLTRLAESGDRERAAIAADIHDDSVQSLTALGLRFTVLARRIRDIAPQLDPDVAALHHTLTSAVQRLRKLMFDLEPIDPALATADALRGLVDQVFADEPMHTAVQAEPGVELASVERRQAVRVVREALINVRKHARAQEVVVELRRARGGVEIAVSDDGVGVGDEAAGSPPGHRGLTTMRDRAELSGGSLRIERRSGSGTTVRLWFPSGAG